MSLSTHVSECLWAKLVSLPRSPTVVELLDEFQAYVLENKPARYAHHFWTLDSSDSS